MLYRNGIKIMMCIIDIRSIIKNKSHRMTGYTIVQYCVIWCRYIKLQNSSCSSFHGDALPKSQDRGRIRENVKWQSDLEKNRGISKLCPVVALFWYWMDHEKKMLEILYTVDQHNFAARKFRGLGPFWAIIGDFPYVILFNPIKAVAKFSWFTVILI